MDDAVRICRDCGAPFSIREGAQLFFASRELALPVRCRACRAARRTAAADSRIPDDPRRRD